MLFRFISLVGPELAWLVLPYELVATTGTRLPDFGVAVCQVIDIVTHFRVDYYGVW